jgi:hypothetical protein
VKFENAADIMGRMNLVTATNGTMMDIGTGAIITTDRDRRRLNRQSTFLSWSDAAADSARKAGRPPQFYIQGRFHKEFREGNLPVASAWFCDLPPRLFSLRYLFPQMRKQ